MTLVEFFERFPQPASGAGTADWVRYYDLKLCFHRLHRPNPAEMAECREAIREFRGIHRERMRFRRLNAARGRANAGRTAAREGGA